MTRLIPPIHLLDMRFWRRWEQGGQNQWLHGANPKPYGVNLRLDGGSQARLEGLVEPGSSARGGSFQLGLEGFGTNDAAVFV